MTQWSEPFRKSCRSMASFDFDGDPVQSFTFDTPRTDDNATNETAEERYGWSTPDTSQCRPTLSREGLNVLVFGSVFMQDASEIEGYVCTSIFCFCLRMN